MNNSGRLYNETEQNRHHSEFDSTECLRMTSSVLKDSSDVKYEVSHSTIWVVRYRRVYIGQSCKSVQSPNKTQICGDGFIFVCQVERPLNEKQRTK